MNLPALLALDGVLSDIQQLAGVLVLLASVVLALGETRWQVSHIREWRRTMDAEFEALRERLTAIEVREGRTLERLDALADRLNRIEAKLDKLLERRDTA